jgi:hypothetical protein
MSKDDPVIRKSVSLRASLWRKIEEHRDREGLLTTADAVRRLLQSAVKREAKEAKR